MKHKTGILSVLLCLALLCVAPSKSGFQIDQDTPKTGDKVDKKGDADSLINVRFRISAENKDTLPTQSKVELSGADEKCKNVHGNQDIKSGEVMFTKMPVCKIKLKIFVTGFDTRVVIVDLAGYKEPMLVALKANGTTVVTPSP
ncbi:MAG TPA: hypothetical protein VNH19_24540 [Candidatus Limnocylindrales bacterium]|nr:hypothetical protein [Candidatus Limnocylindrales bacterium]